MSSMQLSTGSERVHSSSIAWRRLLAEDKLREQLKAQRPSSSHEEATQILKKSAAPEVWNDDKQFLQWAETSGVLKEVCWITCEPNSSVLNSKNSSNSMPKPLTALSKTFARSRLVTEPSFAPIGEYNPSFSLFSSFPAPSESPFQVPFCETACALPVDF